MNGIEYYLIQRDLTEANLVIDGGISHKIVHELRKADVNTNVFASTIMKASDYLHVPVDELLRTDYKS